MFKLGHVAGAEQDWAEARHTTAEALAAKGHSAAEAQEALAGLAEVAWAENDWAQAEQLLTRDWRSRRPPPPHASAPSSC